MKLIEIEHAEDTYFARPLTARHTMVVVKMSEKNTTQSGLESMEYVVWSCLWDKEVDRPTYTEEQKDEVKNLPFSLIKAVADAVFEEAGLGDTDKGN